jgi:hypothetical protein
MKVLNPHNLFPDIDPDSEGAGRVSGQQPLQQLLSRLCLDKGVPGEASPPETGDAGRPEVIHVPLMKRSD